MRINEDAGCIYDTIVFLSAFIDGNTNGLSNDTLTGTSIYYQELYETVRNKVTVPSFLHPLLRHQKTTGSFLYGTLFDRAYSECTVEKLRIILNNRLYMKRRFISHYFPEADEPTVNKLLSMDHLDVIDIMIHRSMDSVQEKYFFYIYTNFDRVLQALIDVVMLAYSQVDAFRRATLQPAYKELLKSEATYLKLKAITGAHEVNETDFTVSLSIMDADLFSYRANERGFVLLGYDFEKRLNSEYNYCDVSLYSFAQAISSSPTKYDIFNALLTQSPMTSAELSTQLNLSRPTLEYNLGEMIKSRLILVEPINKRTNKYSINFNLLEFVSGQLRSLVYKQC